MSSNHYQSNFNANKTDIENEFAYSTYESTPKTCRFCKSCSKILNKPFGLTNICRDICTECERSAKNKRSINETVVENETDLNNNDDKPHSSEPKTKKMRRSDSFSELINETTISSEYNTVRTLNAQSGLITWLDFLLDGSLVSLSNYGSLKIWNVENGELIKSLDSKSQIYSFAVLPNNKLVTYSTPNITIWNTNDWKILKSLKANKGCVKSYAIKAHDYFAAGAQEIIIWNLNSWRRIKTIKCNDSIAKWSLTFLPDGNLASGGQDFKIKVWNVKNGKLLKSLNGHSGYVKNLTILSDETLASTGGLTIRIWNIKTWTTLKVLEGHQDWIYKMLLIKDGTLASCSDDGTIRIWDIEENKTVQILNTRQNNLKSMAILPNGTLASGTDSEILIWTR